MDTKSKIIAIAEAVIINYIQQNYSTKHNIDEEIKRIKNIFEGLDVSFEDIIPGVPTRATNYGNGKITLRFDDKNNISEEEMIEAIETLIHEYYHSISRREKGTLFLEEGYVTYITAETVRYGIENPIEIGDVNREELKELLQKQDLINGYPQASEIVRSIQLVMEQYGIDSKYEYIFNGIDRLKEIVQKISPEFGKILEWQEIKNTNSPTLKVEEKVFGKAFEKIDFSNLSLTLVEMNKLLQGYLIQSGEIDKSKRVYDIVKEFQPESIEYQEFYSKVKDLPEEEILKRLYSELPQGGIDYEVNENISQTIRQMHNIAKNYKKSNSPIKPNTFGAFNFYSILIAYDIIQKGINEPTQEDIMKYCNYLVFDKNNESMLSNKILSYMDYVRTGCEQGKSLQQLLNENLANNMMFAINMKKINESDLTMSEKATKSTEFLLHQSLNNKEHFYDYYYSVLFKIQEKHLDENHIYDEQDYDEFVTQMRGIFDKVQMPQIMEKTGSTPELMFIKSISDNLDISSKDFPQQVTNLLKIINSRKPNLGKNTGRLDDLGFDISIAYEMLKQSPNPKLLQEFSMNLVRAKFENGYDSNFNQATSIEKRKGNITFLLPNNNIENTVKNIIRTPEFYQNLDEIKEMFDKDPKIYEIIFSNNEFTKMVVQQLPEEAKEKLVNEKYISISDIKKAVFGCREPKVEQFSGEDLEGISPLVQFAMKYDTYQQLLKQNKKEEAEQLFSSELIAEHAKEKNVLDFSTIVTMAKNPYVQLCQPVANQEFANIENLQQKNQNIEGKEIS